MSSSNFPLFICYKDINQTTIKMGNTIIEEVHISQIVAGDTIVCSDGEIRTVCRKDIKHDSFFGPSIFGNSYISKYQYVNRVKFVVPTNSGIVYR